MKTHHAFALAIVTAIVLVSSPLRAQKTSVPNGLVSANNVFAFDLYQQLRTQEGNLFLSPYSISTVLAMAYGGARGETERQMAKTLHFSLPPDKVLPGFAALEKEINAVQQKGKVKLLLANSLWPRKKFALSSRSLALCKTYYGTSITPLDYAGATEKSRQTINDWVESNTAKKITGSVIMVTRMKRLRR